MCLKISSLCACVSFAVLMHGATASAQAASSSARRSVFIAEVFASNDSAALGDAEILIPELSRETRTDFSGGASITDVPNGSFQVVVRKLGYVAADVTILFDRDTVRFDFLLAPRIRSLDTVTTTADRIRDGRLHDFDIRQRMGIGHFLTDSVLRKEATRSLADIIAEKIPGIAAADYGRTVVRRLCVGPTGNPIENGAVTVYVDGVRTTPRPSGHAAPDATDLRAILGGDVAGVEYYTAASAPVQFRDLGQACGVLLIWLRH